MTLDLSALKKEARKKGTSAARLLELAALDPQLSRTVAKSKHTPANVLEQLSRSQDMPTRRAVASNPSTPPALLARLAQDRQWTVLKEVATHPNTDEPTLNKLARHTRHTVRQALLQNTALPVSVLENLAQEADETIRASVAYHDRTPPHLMQQLWADNAPGVQAAALQHDQMPNATRRAALTHPEPLVRCAALESLANQRLDGLTPDELRSAAEDDAVAVRRVAAQLLQQSYQAFYSLLPAGFVQELADQLMRDDDEEVLISAAHICNPALLHHLLPLLKQPGDESLLHSDVFSLLAERNTDPTITRILLEGVPAWGTEFLASRSPDQTLYATLLTDPDARDALPHNPHIPDHFWIQVGAEALTDPVKTQRDLPLVMRALEGENHRAGLFQWFATWIDDLLRVTTLFKDEKRAWYGVDALDLARILMTYDYGEHRKPVQEILERHPDLDIMKYI